MKRLSLTILFLLQCSVWIFCHAEMISSTDFEKFEAGKSLSRDAFLKAGFQIGSWDNALETRTTIDSTESSSGRQSMRIVYPEGGVGPEETGCQVQLKFDGRSEAYSSYYLKFSKRFSWGTTNYGGKLPGLAGGGCCSGGTNCDGTNGFTARLMWRSGGQAVLYLYHMDKPDLYGEDVILKHSDGTNVYFRRGEWYHIAERVKINSDASHYDGEVEIWINGEQVLLKTGLRFTSNGDMVDNLYISTFHGGDDDTWAASNTCHTWIDDIRIGTSYEDIAYQTCRKLELGQNKTTCTGAKSYRFKPDQTSSGCRYTWLYENSFLSADSAISVWTPGQYVLIADSDWCTQKDTVLLLNSLQPDLGGDRNICNTSFVELSTGMENNSALQFRWFCNDTPMEETGNRVFIKNAGTYKVGISSKSCETAWDSIKITSGLIDIDDAAGHSGDLAILTAKDSGFYEWYGDSTLTDLLEVGSSYATTIDKRSRYIYVKDKEAYSGLVGKKETSTNTYTRNKFDSEWMLFSVYKSLTIDSISIYPARNLTAVIRIVDDKTGDIIATRTFDNLDAGENRIPIHAFLQPGKYRMDAVGTTDALRHSHTDEDIQFPYTIDDLISIDGCNVSWINDKPWYMFFYNWRVSSGNTCAATPVQLKNIESSDFIVPAAGKKIEVYPKFTDNEVNIEGLSGKSSIIIYSPSGRKAFQRRYKQPNVHLFISEWRQGSYVLLIEDESGVHTHHIIKF